MSVSKRFSISFLIAAAILIFTAVDVIAAPVLNFSQVSAGVYRGGRPRTQAAMNELAGLGIKTIINLQGADLLLHVAPGEWPWGREAEGRRARAAGLNYYSLPIPAFREIRGNDEERIVQTVKLMGQPSLQPVFVHCNLGDDRTGLAVALYRVVYEGWDVDRAYEEMVDHGHNLIQNLATSSLHRFLYRYARENPSRVALP